MLRRPESPQFEDGSDERGVRLCQAQSGDLLGTYRLDLGALGLQIDDADRIGFVLSDGEGRAWCRAQNALGRPRVRPPRATVPGWIYSGFFELPRSTHSRVPARFALAFVGSQISNVVRLQEEEA